MLLCQAGCYLPCDPSYPEDRLSIYLEDAGASLVLTAPQHRDMAAALSDAEVGGSCTRCCHCPLLTCDG